VLKPVLKWTAPLVQIHTIKAGATVGYGQTWKAQRDSRIGIVPVGYADGYPRVLSNRGVMMVQGKPCPVAGRVSMDLTTVDLTDVPQPMLGDEVGVLDSDPLSPASVYELARLAGTIPYEITCGIGPRIHRVPVEIEQGVLA
jgi:alanine racemase